MDKDEVNTIRRVCYRIGGLMEGRDPEDKTLAALISIRDELEELIKPDNKVIL